MIDLDSESTVTRESVEVFWSGRNSFLVNATMIDIASYNGRRGKLRSGNFFICDLKEIWRYKNIELIEETHIKFFSWSSPDIRLQYQLDFSWPFYGKSILDLYGAV